MAAYPSATFSVEDNADYQDARDYFISIPKYREVVPEFIILSPRLASLKSRLMEKVNADKRAHSVHGSLAPLRFRVFEGEGRSPSEGSYDPATWTGMLTRKQRLQQVAAIVPVAMSAIESLIADLEKSGDNGGPILDHRNEAVEQLRELHRALGEILSSIEDGSFPDDLGGGLPAEAARYAIRAVEALKDDPLPYSVSALLLAVFSMLGFSDAGAWMSAVAVTFTRKP